MLSFMRDCIISVVSFKAVSALHVRIVRTDFTFNTNAFEYTYSIVVIRFTPNNYKQILER